MTSSPAHDPLAVAVRWAAEVPVDLGRDEARELARRELADPAYDAKPSLMQRMIEWISDRVDEVLSQTAGLDGRVAIVVLVALLLLVAAVVVRRVGPMARRAASRAPMFDGTGRRAVDYRAAAESAARRGDWSTAVVERYRAVVAGMEERGILAPRPGRTADEAAAEGGSALPAVAADLAAGSWLFDGVRYGGRTAAQPDDESLRRLDDAVRAARPDRSAAAGTGTPLAAPT